MPGNPFIGRPTDAIVADWVNVTPSNTDDLPNGDVGICIRAVGAGTIVFHNVWGDTISTSVSAGELLPTSVKRVLATGTSATNIQVGLAVRRGS